MLSKHFLLFCNVILGFSKMLAKFMTMQQGKMNRQDKLANLYARQI